MSMTLDETMNDLSEEHAELNAKIADVLAGLEASIEGLIDEFQED